MIHNLEIVCTAIGATLLALVVVGVASVIGLWATSEIVRWWTRRRQVRRAETLAERWADWSVDDELAEWPIGTWGGVQR